MSILTPDYSEMINARKLIRDTAEKERPTSDVRQLKWREIELIQDRQRLARELSDLDYGHEYSADELDLDF